LKRLRLDEDTLVLFSTDHGDACGSHHMFDKGYCMYEEQYRVPLVLCQAGALPAGVQSDEWALTLDLMPTILDFAGCELPADREIDGRSLRSVIESGASLGRDSVFAEFHGMQYGLTSIRMVRDERFKLVLNANDMPELYDLQNDPCELANLAGGKSHAEQERGMLSKLVRWMRETRDPMLKTPWGRAVYDPQCDPAQSMGWSARSVNSGQTGRLPPV
jgi:arylsulfatase A-like enzyme